MAGRDGTSDAVRPALPDSVPPDGSWSGSLGIDDPGGVPLTYDITQTPQQGTVEVFPDGTYTYVPTQAARLRAALAGPGTETTDVFSVEANGGRDGGCGVWVPVAPATISLTHQIPVASTSFPAAIATSSDGSRLYVADVEGNGIIVVDTADYAIQTVALAAFPRAVELGPLDRTLYVPIATVPPQIAVLDTTTLTLGTSIPFQHRYFGGLAVSNDGRHLYVGGESDATVTVLDTSDLSTHVINLPTGPNLPQSLVLSPDGKKAWVCCTSTTGDPLGAWVIDTATHSVTPLQLRTLGGLWGPIAVSPDGSRVYLPRQDGSPTGPGHVTVVDTATYVTHDFALAGSPFAVGVSSDNSVLYVNPGDSHGTIVVVDAKTEQPITSFQTQGGSPQIPSVSPDGTHLYLAQGTPPQIEVYTYAGTGKWTA